MDGYPDPPITRMLRLCKDTGWTFAEYGRQRHLPSAIWSPYHAGIASGAADRGGS